jgi:large subunit ribosomal protein L21e
VVDIAINSAVHAGMPHKYYHGRTGRVFNVTKSGVGIEVNKILREKQLKKRILVKVAHVRHSTALLEIKRRTKENEAHKKAVTAGKAQVR